MTSDELINKSNMVLANMASQQRLELLNNNHVSYSYWLLIVRSYLNLYKAIPTAPQLVELADSLLGVPVELNRDDQVEVYNVLCGYIKRLSAQEDYGSKGTSTL